MGKTPKGWSLRAKRLKTDKRYSKHEKNPKRNPSSFQVGRVNPNLVSSVYSPIIVQLAEKSAEKYASHIDYFLDQEGKKQNLKYGSVEGKGHVEVGINGEEMKHEETLENTNSSNSNNTIQTEEEYMDWSHIDETFDKKFHLFSKQSTIVELQKTIITPTSIEFSSVTNSYKARANVVKFERLLDEKYGFARPLLTHPKVEPYVKFAQRKWATGQISFTRQTPPPIGLTTSIILLFMMYRNGIRKDGIALAALYLLVGLQPWVLLVLVVFGVERLEKIKRKRIIGMTGSTIPLTTSYYHDDPTNRNDILKSPVGTIISPEEQKSLDHKYDVILLGDGPSALYCAALLSRVGRKVLVLSPLDDVSGEMTMKGQNQVDIDNIKDPVGTTNYEDIPFTVHDCKIAHTDRMQHLLAPAIATDRDCQGGIRFATIGSEADGFAHDIFSIPGLGTTGYFENSSTSNDESNTSPATEKSNVNITVPFVLRAGGIQALAEDTASFLGDGWMLNPEDISSSSMAKYATLITDLNNDAGNYYLSKLTDPKYNPWWDTDSRSKRKAASGSTSPDTNEYRVASARYASDFLSHFIPLNSHVRSLCAAMGMSLEDLPPSKCSMAAHISNLSAMVSEEGFTFPVGGMRALGKALENVIVKNGGLVARDIIAQELVFEKKDENDVKKSEKQKKSNQDKTNKSENKKEGKRNNNHTEIGPKCIGVKLSNGTIIETTSIDSDSSKEFDGCVISSHGFLQTFLRLVPDSIRDNEGVPAGLPALKERRPQLKILMLLNGNRDSLNLPSADWWRLPNASLAKDEVDQTSNQVTAGEVGEMSSAINSRKFMSGSSWMRVSFPSTKDPSWEERYGTLSTCVVSIEADDDVVQMFESKPKIFVPKRRNEDAEIRLVQRVLKDVREEFPQLVGNIIKLCVRGPLRMGLSHTPERYVAKGIRPKTHFPNLFMSGSDLTVDTFSGGIVAGWLTANAVLGYNYLHLSTLSKTISYDLQQFLEEPEGEEEAVLYTEKRNNEVKGKKQEDSTQS